VATDVDIFNLALDGLGQTVTISAIGEQTKFGRLAARHYAQTRDELLAAHPWPFARKAAALALTNDTPLLGWGFQYAYPTDCLRAWRVCDADGVRAAWSKWSIYPDPLDFRVGPTAVPFEVVNGGQQTCLVTDQEGAYLFYTARVDESRFPPLFVRALATLIASRIAMPVTVTPQIKQMVENEAAVAFALATAEGLNESAPDPDSSTPSIAVRS
jgi:hypothetical protein